MFGQITVENDDLGDPWAQINPRNNFQSFPQAIQVLFRYGHSINLFPLWQNTAERLDPSPYKCNIKLL